MKTLSAAAEQAVQKPHVAPILLMEMIYFSPSQIILHLCSRAFGTRNSFDGNTYDPLIAGWSEILAGSVDPMSMATGAGECSVSILNGMPVGGKADIATLLQDYDWAFSKVTLKLIHEDALSAADAVSIFSGHVETPEAMRRDVVDLKISGKALGLRDRFPCRFVNTPDYSGADPDDVGKMIPRMLGACKRVPARAVDAGGKTTIAEDMTATVPGNNGTLELTDGSAFPTGAFQLQIDDEQINIASRSGNTLTLAAAGARGYGGTTATAHDRGAGAAEVKTHYYFMAADHAVKSIDAVYVDGVRQEITNGSNSDCRVYYGDADDDLSSYEGKAIIDFQVLPKVVKQVNLGVDEGSHAHGYTGQSTSKRYGLSYAQNCGLTGGANMYDSNDGTYATCGSFDNSDYIIIYFGETDLGTVTSRRVRVVFESWHSGSDLQLKIGSAGYKTLPASGGGTKVECWKTFAGDSWDLDVRFNYVGSDSPQLYVYEVDVEVTYIPSVQSGPASGVALTGNSSADTVIGQSITADIDGMFDRADGFFTGIPDGIIKRPPHVFAKIVMHVLNGAQGLWGYWPCHEGTGTVLHDESGREQNTTNTVGTPEWSTGNSGLSCAKIVGAGEYFYATAFTAPSSYITCSAWVKTDQAATERFFSYYAGSAGGWYLAASTTEIRFWIWDDTPTAHGASYTANIAGAWHHLAGTYDGETIRLYLDGVEVDTDTLSGQTLTDARSLLFGYSNAITTEFEEMRIYDRALSAHEILELYNNPRGANQKYIDLDEGMLHYWRFNDNSGTLAADGKGAIDLVLTGTAGTPTWTDDATRGICLDFDDSDNQTAYNPYLVARSVNPTTAVSVSLWFKVDDLATTHDIISRTNAFYMRISTGGNLTFGTYCGATWDAQGTGAGTISAGTWYHVVGTYDGTDITVVLDDGTPASSAHSAGGDMDTVSGMVCVGAWYNASNFFDGLIDEIFIFDYVLSADEITALYNETFEASTYTATGVKCAENGFELNIAIIEKPFTNDLLNDLALQCRAMQFFEAGVHHLKYLKDAPETDRHISAHRIDLESISLAYTMRAHIKNDIIGVYDRHWNEKGLKAYRAEVTAAAAASINKYGRISLEAMLDYVSESDHAQDIADWLKDLLDEPRLLITFTGDPSFLDLERGDVVQLDTDLADATLGLVAQDDQFRVVGKNYLPDFRQEISVMEI